MASERVHLESLDARDAWPPLLRPGVLAGLEAYDRWEHRVLNTYLAAPTAGRGGAAQALARVVRWTEVIRAWKPAQGALEVAVAKPWSPSDALPRMPQGEDASARLRALRHDLMSRVPRQWQAADWPRGLTDATSGGPPVSRQQAEAALARYLAVRLCGSWVAYQGGGLRSVVASLVSSFALASLALASGGSGTITLGQLTSALRASDWLQLHLLDREVWAAWCKEWEDAEDAAPLLSVVAAAARVLEGLAWAPASSDAPTNA